MERRLTLKQVEAAAGLSATHLSEIERGRTSPTVGALLRIARALGKHPAYFVEPRELPEISGSAGLDGTFEIGAGASARPLSTGIAGGRLHPYSLKLSSTSRGMTSIGIEEPALFAEPAVYLLRPDGTLYYGAVQTMPFARPHFDELLAAIDFAVAKDYPARGEYTGEV